MAGRCVCGVCMCGIYVERRAGEVAVASVPTSTQSSQNIHRREEMVVLQWWQVQCRREGVPARFLHHHHPKLLSPPPPAVCI